MAITIPKETLKVWKSLRSRGDIAKLLSATKIKNKGTLYYVLSTGNCSAKVANQLIRFHARLQKEVKQVQKQLDQE